MSIKNITSGPNGLTLYAETLNCDNLNTTSFSTNDVTTNSITLNNQQDIIVECYYLDIFSEYQPLSPPFTISIKRIDNLAILNVPNFSSFAIPALVAQIFISEPIQPTGTPNISWGYDFKENYSLPCVASLTSSALEPRIFNIGSTSNSFIGILNPDFSDFDTSTMGFPPQAFSLYTA